jgi:hypothetical protein
MGLVAKVVALDRFSRVFLFLKWPFAPRICALPQFDIASLPELWNLENVCLETRIFRINHCFVPNVRLHKSMLIRVSPSCVRNG